MTNPLETFDDIEISRPELAAQYVQALKAQPGRPIALFAPRRVGKTFFLAHDLMPCAEKTSFTPVYADVWLYKAAPLEAINHALEEALDDATVPNTSVGKAIRTPVKKLAALGASVELGQEPTRRPLPQDAPLRFDSLISRLAKATGKCVLLMLDEVQALAQTSQGEAIIATLRAVLHKHQDIVCGVFTGSSQEALSAMFFAAGGPMYQFAQLQNFPVLGQEYLERLAEHFAQVHPGKQLDIAALAQAFEHLGYKPALMKDLVKLMSAEGLVDVGQGLQLMAQDQRQVAGWCGLLASLSALEQAVLVQIAHGALPMSKDTLNLLQAQGLAATPQKIRTAIERLQAAGIVSKLGRTLKLEDALFADYLLNLKK